MHYTENPSKNRALYRTCRSEGKQYHEEHLAMEEQKPGENATQRQILPQTFRMPSSNDHRWTSDFPSKKHAEWTCFEQSSTRS